MSTAGSGNQGICASLPVAAAARRLRIDEEPLLRAEALSQLITIHIKTHIGKLSPLCGCAIAASIGSAAGITYLLGGGLTEILYAIQNMISDISGLICDGAKSSCALKIASSLASAIQCARLANAGVTATKHDGIIAADAEESIRNLANLGSAGMDRADRVILDMMITK
jgi:L-cysteine desulfidase